MLSENVFSQVFTNPCRTGDVAKQNCCRILCPYHHLVVIVETTPHVFFLFSFTKVLSARKKKMLPQVKSDCTIYTKGVKPSDVLHCIKKKQKIQQNIFLPCRSKKERERLLQGTGVPEAVDRDESNIHKEYTTVVLPFMTRHPDLWNPSVHTLELYTQLVAFIMAYR